jgi:hypothetical protein
MGRAVQRKEKKNQRCYFVFKLSLYIAVRFIQQLPTFTTGIWKIPYLVNPVL